MAVRTDLPPRQVPAEPSPEGAPEPEAEVVPRSPRSQAPEAEQPVGPPTSRLWSALRSLAEKLDLSLGQPLDPALRRERLRRGVGFSLLSLGLCLIMFLGYLFVFSGLQEARNQRHLLDVFRTPAGAVPLSGAVPKDGQPAAILTIPAIHLHQVVVQGTTSADLLMGPGIMPNTARPGTKGNAVIAGRHSTGGAVFASLGALQRGDAVYLVTGLGHFRYVVTGVHTAQAGQRSPASPKPRAQLTLMTSSSLSSTGLLYATTRMVSLPGTAPRPRHPPSPAELGLAGDPSAWPPTILWGLLLGACLLGSFVAYSRARSRTWTVYLLTTPIILAVALEWYHYLYLLLPATT